MDVGSSFRIYGDYFGWYVFDQLYAFLIVTGLWTVPFLFYFYQAFFGNRGGGEGYAFKPFASLKTFEMLLYPGIVIFFLFMYPLVPANNASFVYNDGVTEQTNGATGTTYDQLAETMPSETIRIPAGWYAIMWLTSGVNQLVKVILPTGADIRGLMYQQQQMSIDDPEVRKEFAAFENHCLIPAHIRYNIIKQKYPTSQMNAQFVAIQAATSEEDAYKVAPTYPGNLFYMDYLYNNNVCSAADVSGLNSLCIPKTGGILSPQNAGYGQTSCASWWANDLKDKVANDFAGNNLSIAGGTWATVFSSDNTVNRLIFGKLGQSNSNVSESGLGDSNGGDWGWGWFKEKVAAVAVAIGGFFMQFPTTVIKFMLPIILAASIMILIIVMPIFIVFALYRPEKLMTLVVLFFGVSFIPAIWYIAAWIDIVVLKVIWGDRTFIEGVFSLGHGIWNIFSLAIYYYFTKWWLQYLTTIGARAASGITEMTSDGVSSGGKAMNEGVNRGTQAASAGKK
jgi:hypothetical protein